MKKIILFCFISLLLISSCKNNDTEKKVITQLSLSQNQAQLAQGDSLSLILSYTPADLPAPTCIWTSSDSTVARVDNKGKIKALGRGTTTIMVATTADASGIVISAQCKLTVTYKGDGSASNPYLIYTVADLKAIRDSINTKNDVYGNKAYKLMADLDFTKETGDWTPIGDTTTVAFKGVFDGNRKTIKGVRIGSYGFRKNIQYAGFFGVIDEAEIKNLGVAWDYITPYTLTKNINYYIGCIAAYGSGNITDCSSSGSFCSYADTCYDGGIIGYGCATTNITNCHYETGTVSSTNYQEQPQYCVGGIAGYISGTISNCYSNGLTNGSDKYEGGIAGYSIGTIVNCYCTNGTSIWFIPECTSGGIAGHQTGTIVNCYSTNEAQGGYAGGIVGEGGNITNCYATGFVLGKKYACGIAATANNVNYCIALNSNYSGGTLIANIYGYGSISNVSNVSRICYLLPSSAITNGNYAATSIVMKNHYRTDETITDFSDTKLNGFDLTAQPVDLLNAYVSANPTFNNIGLKRWKVTAGVNNGYPVFE